MENNQKYGTQIEVDIVEQVGDDRTKVGDAVLIARADGCSMSVAPWSDLTLTAGNTYQFILKPGSDREILWPEYCGPNAGKSSIEDQSE